MHSAETPRACFNLATFGHAIVIDDVGDATRTAVEKLPALHRQHVVVFGQQDTRCQSLILAKIGRPVAIETNAACDLVIDDLRGHGDEFTVIAISPT